MDNSPVFKVVGITYSEMVPGTEVRASLVRRISQQCALCDHFNRVSGKCRAFDGPPPPGIRDGLIDHSEPYPGDNGARFTPLPKGAFYRYGSVMGVVGDEPVLPERLR